MRRYYDKWGKKTFKRFGEKWISIKKSYVDRKESSQRKRFNKEIRNIKKNMVDMFCNYHIGSNRKFFQWSRQNINYALYLVDQCCVCNRSDGNPNFRKCIYSKKRSENTSTYHSSYAGWKKKEYCMVCVLCRRWISCVPRNICNALFQKAGRRNEREKLRYLVCQGSMGCRFRQK